MTCEAYFDARNISAWSYANEVFITTSCVPNSAKLAIFVVLMICFHGILGTALVFFVPRARHDFRKKKLERQTMIFGLIALAALSGIICVCMYLSGVQHYARYLVYPVDGVCMQFAITGLYSLFSEATANLHQNRASRIRAAFIISMTGSNAVAIVCYVGCLGVLPFFFARAGNATAVNICFTCFTIMYGVLRTWMTTAFMLDAWELIKILKIDDNILSQANDAQVQERTLMRKRLIKLMRLCASFYFLQVAMAGTGAWFHFTALEGAFYVYFIFCQMNLIVAGGGIMYFFRQYHTNKSSVGEGSGSQPKTSESNRMSMVHAASSDIKLSPPAHEQP